MGQLARLRRVVLVYAILESLLIVVYLARGFGDWVGVLDTWLVATTHLPLGEARTLGGIFDVTLIMLVAILPGIFFYTLRIGRAFGMVVLTAAGLGAAWAGVYTYYGYYLPAFYMWLAMAGGTGVAVVFKMVFASHEQEFLRVAFSQFVSPEVLRELLKDPNKLALQGRELMITVMFLDIRGFTAFAGKHNAVLVVNRLNLLLDIATQIIFKHGGTLDKYIGDAVMAFWGAPTADKKQAQNAVLAAVEIRERILKETEFLVGVGINFGSAIVGNIGSTRRFDYTAIGDTVNTAARLESATKEMGESIVLSEALVAKLEEEKANISKIRAKGQILVRGKEMPIAVFAI